VLYRTDRLETYERKMNSINTRVAICIRGRRGTLLEPLGRTVVMSLHLDARSEESRVEQLTKCLAMVREAGVREVILAGDFNTECKSGSCVGALLPSAVQPSSSDMARECASAHRLNVDGDGDKAAGDASCSTKERLPSEQQLDSWRALWNKSRDASGKHRIELSHVLTGPTRAAYDAGSDSGPCVSWRLDHILYHARTLALRGTWEALEADPVSAASGIPNHSCPSDHLPVAAVFEPSPTPVLAEDERIALRTRLDVLEEKHVADWNMLAKEIAILDPTPAVKAPAPSDSEAVVDGAPPKKKQKGATKKGRQSEEMIAFIREGRRRRKELGAQHSDERRAFVNCLGELERDSLEEWLSIDDWAETGKRS